MTTESLSPVSDLLQIVQPPPVGEGLARFGDLSREELSQWCQAHGAKPFRADQIRSWVYGKRVMGFDAMTDLPAILRAELKASFSLFTSTIVQHQVSKDGTEKLLLEMIDGHYVECVLMREDDRRTICISTQVGCAMGCVFCASGLMGVKRNLTSGEILEQVLRLDRLLPITERITNIVVMGIGEPLANLKNLIPALDTLNQNGGMGIGARRITVSTVGLPDKIRELARLGKQYNLAVSLHASNDTLRTQLVPVNSKIGIAAILDATDDYFDQTGRRVTYEYVLLGGMNDAPEHARELVTLLQNRFAHVNVIPMNHVETLPFVEPNERRKREFIAILEAAGIPATIRKRKGADIDAACGQLRLKQEQSSTEITEPAVSNS
jgi:23S rRNA (adenine2503-C2)-methyltransferase